MTVKIWIQLHDVANFKKGKKVPFCTEVNESELNKFIPILTHIDSLNMTYEEIDVHHHLPGFATGKLTSKEWAWVVERMDVNGDENYDGEGYPSEEDDNDN